MSQQHPPPEILALLRPVERRAYQLAAIFAGPLKWAATFWLTWVGSPIVGISGWQRFRVTGLENLEKLGPKSRVLLVANHRSFWDFFIIAHILFVRTRLSHRLFFPVRSTYFYESAMGAFINLLMAGMCMFPPILRNPTRSRWNGFAMRRCLYDLTVPGTLVGLHPEGKRGQHPDPYEFLPAQPGTGRLAIESDAEVVPIFVLGMTNDFVREVWLNYRDPKSYPVDIVFGAPIDMSEFREGESTPARWQEASDHCMAKVGELGALQRRIAGVEDEIAPSQAAAP